MASSSSSSPNVANKSSWLTYCLLVIIALQWVLFSFLLQHTNSNEGGMNVDRPSGSAKVTENVKAAQSQGDDQPLTGVFASVIFRAPKWMHLRYTLMVHNAISNLPRSGWKIQLFLNRPWVEKEMFPWHPGFQRLLLNHSKVIVTDLPQNLTLGARPRDIMLSSWFYHSLVADHVLLFSANGAFCGNHPQPEQILQNMLDSVDYCGAPWHQGSGGDGGTHSFRNRHAFLRVLEYAEEHNKPFSGGSTEYAYFLQIMKEMNHANLANFRIATEDQTHDFGGVYNLSDSNSLLRLPLVISGTQARLQWSERESLLKHCPEIKMIFPSLHEPTCFGAHPVAETCQVTICAVGQIPKQGC